MLTGTADHVNRLLDLLIVVIMRRTRADALTLSGSTILGSETTRSGMVTGQ